jgi:hypothetical protein
MPDKKTTNKKGTPAKNKQRDDENAQEEMQKTGTSDPNLSNYPLENFERESDSSIQRGQRIVQNERQGT